MPRIGPAEARCLPTDRLMSSGRPGLRCCTGARGVLCGRRRRCVRGGVLAAGAAGVAGGGQAEPDDHRRARAWSGAAGAAGHAAGRHRRLDAGLRVVRAPVGQQRCAPRAPAPAAFAARSRPAGLGCRTTAGRSSRRGSSTGDTGVLSRNLRHRGTVQSMGKSSVAKRYTDPTTPATTSEAAPSTAAPTLAGSSEVRAVRRRRSPRLKATMAPSARAPTKKTKTSEAGSPGNRGPFQRAARTAAKRAAPPATRSAHSEGPVPAAAPGSRIATAEASHPRSRRSTTDS